MPGEGFVLRLEVNYPDLRNIFTFDATRRRHAYCIKHKSRSRQEGTRTEQKRPNGKILDRVII